MRQDADDGPLVRWGALEELVGPGDDDLVGGREPLAGGEDGPRVAHRYAVAQELADPRHRAREVYRPEDVHPGRRGEGLDEDRHVFHPALAARAEVDCSRAPTLEHPARRLDYRPVE